MISRRGGVKWEEGKERKKKEETATRKLNRKHIFLQTDCSRGGNNNSINRKDNT